MSFQSFAKDGGKVKEVENDLDSSTEDLGRHELSTTSDLNDPFMSTYRGERVMHLSDF
jgi:hypothetical protein